MPGSSDDDQDGWAIYARLSRKPSGKKLRNDNDTVDRQIALNRRYAAARGIPVSEAHIYTDNHRSAWDGGEREGWDQMLKAAAHGEFPGVLVYKLDRFSRNVRDAEDMVDLADKIRVDGPNSGPVNLLTAHGKKTFREAAVQGAAESDNTGERARDALAERAKAGLLLGGGRIYGFKILSEVREFYDDVEPVVDEAEAAVIREVAGRMIAGEPLKAIARDLNVRGLLTSRGAAWTGATLGRMIGAPRYGGYAVLNGKVAGRITGEPILDADTYAQVQAILAGRRRGRVPTGTYQLTGVLRCASPRCPRPGRTMAGHASGGSPGARVRKYTCPACGLVILAAPVEEHVRDEVLRRLEDRDTITRLSAQNREAASAASAAREQAHAEISRVKKLLVGLERRRYADEASGKAIIEEAYEAVTADLTARLATAQARLDALPAPGATAGEDDLPAMSAEEYDAMAPAELRELTAQLGLEITVGPQRPGTPRNRPDLGRVQVREVPRR